MTASKLILFLTILPCTLAAQIRDSVTDDTVDRRRLRTVVIGGGAAYGVTLAGLAHLWYKESGRQSFRFFDDNGEWKQMDKVGHFYSAFHLSHGTFGLLRWSKIPEK